MILWPEFWECSVWDPAEMPSASRAYFPNTPYNKRELELYPEFLHSALDSAPSSRPHEILLLEDKPT